MRNNGAPVDSVRMSGELTSHEQRGGGDAGIAAERYMNLATVKARISSVLTTLDRNDRAPIALLAHDTGPE